MTSKKNCCAPFDYKSFNRILKNELKEPLLLEHIAIKRADFFNFPLELMNVFCQEEDLTINDYLYRLRDKEGLYFLWSIEEKCIEHNNYKLRCVYVGKGQLSRRIKAHIDTKWKNSDGFIASFYECENRISKYLEQTILDCYSPCLNKAEKRGLGDLMIIIDRDLAWFGRNSHEYASAYASKNFSDSW